MNEHFIYVYSICYIFLIFQNIMLNYYYYAIRNENGPICTICYLKFCYFLMHIIQL